MIYDCFLYYDEDMLLDIRLHTLADVVDRFVIVEATHSFTGIPRIAFRYYKVCQIQRQNHLRAF
ncbi:hypothetical protein ACJU28_10420 [Enterobacter hormaechei]|uniref:hypothetical protein n=1 Tax=Enterobacter hormaechei TaxID=158836 RepID=UPI003DA47CE3